MTAVQDLLSFKGRLGRLAYFSYTCLAVLAFSVVFGFGLVATASNGGVLPLLFVVMAFTSIPIVWTNLALTAKRLHDMNMSGLHLIWICGVFGPLMGLMDAISPVFGAIISLGLFLWLVFTPGSPGPNRFDQSPSEPSGSPAAAPEFKASSKEAKKPSWIDDDRASLNRIAAELRSRGARVDVLEDKVAVSLRGGSNVSFAYDMYQLERLLKWIPNAPSTDYSSEASSSSDQKKDKHSKSNKEDYEISGLESKIADRVSLNRIVAELRSKGARVDVSEDKIAVSFPGSSTISYAHDIYQLERLLKWNPEDFSAKRSNDTSSAFSQKQNKPSESNDRESNSGDRADDIKFLRVKEEFAKMYHPRNFEGSSLESIIRKEIFKEFWSKIEEIENGRETVQPDGL